MWKQRRFQDHCNCKLTVFLKYFSLSCIILQSLEKQKEGEPTPRPSVSIISSSERRTRYGCEGSQMLFYVWFEFTSWLRGVGQGKGAWDCFLTIWAWDNCAFCQWDQWLLRDWTFILQMTLSWPDVDSLGLLPSALMFCLNLKKVPPPILTIKIPCKNDLRWDLRWLQITTHVIE